MQPGRGQAQDHLGVARGQKTAFQQLQRVLGQVHQAQAVGHGAAAFAQLCGRLLLRQAAAVHQLADARGLLHRVQVLALQVFDQCQLHRLLVGHLAHHHGHLRKARQPGGAPAALARDDGIAAGGPGPHRDGLQKAVLGDAGGQLGQGLVVKGFAGLAGVRLDLAQRQLLHAAAVQRGGGVLKQAFQPAAQPSLSFCHGSSPFLSRPARCPGGRRVSAGCFSEIPLPGPYTLRCPCRPARRS